MAIVTDSAAAFPGGLPDGVHCLPLRILLEDRDVSDDGSISVTQVLAELALGRSVTTSRPSPGQFTDLFDQCAQAGLAEILMISVSAELSGTFAAAHWAARSAAIPVHCCDSQSLGPGQGYLVAQAVRAARAGRSGAELQDLVQNRAAAGRGFFVFQEPAIAHSGRLSGPPPELSAAALGLKVELTAGKLAPTGSVTTAEESQSFLLGAAVESLGLGHLVGITHVQNEAAAQALARQLIRLVPAAAVEIVQASAVLAVHGGAGAIGFLSLPKHELG